MKTRIFTLLFTLLTSFSGFSQWIVRETPVTANLYCLSFIDQTTGMVAGAQGTVLKTADGGLSWLSFNVANEDFRTICMVNYETHFVGGQKLYKTIDGGDHWEMVDGFNYPSSIIFTDDLNGKVTTAAGVYETHDGGLTWNMILNGSTTVFESTITLESTAYALGNVGGFQSYSFIAEKSFENNYYPLDVYYMPNSNAFTTAHAYNADTLYVCLNHFNNWVPGDINQFVRFTNFQIEPNYFQDSTWSYTAEVITDFVPDLMTSIYMKNNTVGYGCGQNGSIYNTKDGGITWIPDYDGTIPLSKMQFIDNEYAYAVGNNGLVLKHTYVTNAKDIKLSTGLSIYPNPAVESININATTPVKRVEIINTDGRVVISKDQSSVKESNINLEGLGNGIYQVRLTMADGTVRASKVIVQR